MALGALAVALGGSASAAKAAAGTPGLYASNPATATILNHSSQLPHGIAPNRAFAACQGFTDIFPTGPCALKPPAEEDGLAGSPTLVPHTGHSASGPAAGPGSLGSNFNGLSDLSQRTATGFHITPPDQGLCVGPAGPLEGAGVPLGVPANTTVVLELVNDGWAVYTKTGTQLILDSNADLFSDGNSSGDIECNYDPSTSTYFFTEIGAANGQYYDTNLAVLNSHGYSAYDVNTSESGYCFPDFPHQGYDTNALYITINEFCGANEDFAGAAVFGFSKKQLVNHQVPNGVVWTLGINYYTFRGVTGAGNTEYLLASEQNDVTQNHLDLAKVTGDNKLATGGGPIYLSVTSVASEPFSEPVDAQSTGDGTTCERDFGGWCSVPESSLEPNDMRLGPVQYSNGQLFAALPSSMTVGSDPTVVDGLAWFQVDPGAAKVKDQGYIGVAGTYLLMPSFVQSKSGALLAGFSMTSPSLNPSAGYVVSKNGGKSFSSVTTTGLGSGPHISFSGQQPGYLRKRWGDYSTAVIDPATGGVWFADEYIPSGAEGADTVDNWGTRVWMVNP